MPEAGEAGQPWGSGRAKGQCFPDQAVPLQAFVPKAHRQRGSRPKRGQQACPGVLSPRSALSHHLPWALACQSHGHKAAGKVILSLLQSSAPRGCPSPFGDDCSLALLGRSLRPWQRWQGSRLGFLLPVMHRPLLLQRPGGPSPRSQVPTGAGRTQGIRSRKPALRVWLRPSPERLGRTSLAAGAPRRGPLSMVLKPNRRPRPARPPGPTPQPALPLLPLPSEPPTFQ